MSRDQRQYDDAIEFLARVEDPARAGMNRRSRLTDAAAAALRAAHPGVPDDFVAYLREVGRGAFRECQFTVYGGLTAPEDLYDWLPAEVRVLGFGDNFAGDVSGFLPDEGWAVVELWHDAAEVYRTGRTFGQYIRECMLMGPNGEDTRWRPT